MYLDLHSTPATGFFLVGNEQTPIPEIRHRGDSLSFIFSEYGAMMEGIWKDDEWKGNYIRFRAETTSAAFLAKPRALEAPSERAAKSEVPPGVRLVGTFQVYFQSEAGLDSATAGSFRTVNDSIYGTFVAPDGDYGLLVGKQIGNKVQLNRFTGWQVIALDLKQSNGQWSGSYLVRGEPARLFTMLPKPSLPKELPKDRRTSVVNPKSPFYFTGISASGDTIRSTDERYKGKILVVDIMGTWCHNCMDAAPLLEQISREFKDVGVEVVGLSFENSDDIDLAKKNLGLYAQRHGITFPLLFCGSTDEKNVDTRLRSQLDNFFAYPTTLFVNRKGLVHSIHVGFKGPGTGEEYQRQVEEFYAAVKEVAQ